jgi:hypothetical protein
MKYVLVDRGDNIVDRVDLGSGVGESGARTYFIKRKQIGDEEFDGLWKVMAELTYDRKLRDSMRTNGSHHQYKWWKDEDYLDIDK